MTVPVYYETDADLSIVQKKRVAFIGYGNSHTSQYGQLRGMLADDGEWVRQKIKRVLEESILWGNFAREWSDVQAKGLEKLEQLCTQALASPVEQAEKRLRQSREEHA
jgi:ketol-acid reductoisomerase